MWPLITNPNGARAEVLGAEDDQAWQALLVRSLASRAIVPRWEELSGWTTHRIAVRGRDEALAGGLLLATRRIPKLPFHLGRVTALMLEPGREPACLERLLRELERFSNRHLVVETEVRVRIPATDGLEGFEYHRDVTPILADFGYRPLRKIETTYFVRIDRDDDALLGSFQSSVRNMIRRAQKSGVQVATSRDYTLLDEFYAALEAMGERKDAPVPPRVFVADGIVPLLDRGWAVLATESYAGKIATMVIADALGVPCYTLGARTKASVDGRVRGAAQVVQYELMRLFRDRGKRYYDLGGCEGPVPIAGHPNLGVWRFKYGFGGTFVQFLPYFRKVRGPFLHSVMEAVHRLRGDYV